MKQIHYTVIGSYLLLHRFQMSKINLISVDLIVKNNNLQIVSVSSSISFLKETPWLVITEKVKKAMDDI